MLHDRRVLLEKEIEQYKATASKMYLQIAIQSETGTKEDELTTMLEYNRVREKLSNLMVDLFEVSELIKAGSK